MKTLRDHIRVNYKNHNKNVFVSKRTHRYLLELTESQLDNQLAADYHAIADAPRGSYQTPINQVELIATLAKSIGAKNVLEIGTFKGFTALYLKTILGKDCRITTCEIDDENITASKALWKKYGLQEDITLVAGNAVENMKSLQGEYDLVYIDADKKNYPLYYQEATRLCKKGGLILLDNMLWAGLAAEKKTDFLHAQILGNLNKEIYSAGHANVAMIPAWDGLLVVVN